MPQSSVATIKTIIRLAAMLVLFSGLLVPDREGYPAQQAPLVKTVDQDYVPKPEAVALLQKVDQPVEIVLFHGAWCKDCQREVPRFMRILEIVGNAHFVLTDYEVNPQKQDALGKFDEYGVKSVPTIIFFRGGKELGRIVEKPRLSLEEDFAAIVTGKP